MLDLFYILVNIDRAERSWGGVWAFLALRGMWRDGRSRHARR